MKYLPLFLFLMVCISSCRSRIYRRFISRMTPKNKRYWSGPHGKSNNRSWQVRIVSADGAFSCGGAYIAPLLVVTSAYCVEPFRYVLDHISVESLAQPAADFDQYSTIDTIYTPDGPNAIFADIAVVRLKRPIQGKLTEFIRLCRTEITDGMKLTAIGYGRRKSEIHPTGTFSNSTLAVEVGDKCREKFLLLEKATDTSFCVLQPDPERKCHYDGGSPIIWKNQLCGLVSWGRWCELDSYPDIYIDINKVKEFIEETERGILSGELV